MTLGLRQTRMLRHMYGARFDDAGAGRSFVLSDPKREILAMNLEEVAPAIAAASRAAAEGDWVAGYVAYEAAPGFDQALRVNESEALPLVWFGVFGDRVEAEPLRLDPRTVGAFSVSRWDPAWDRNRYEGAFAAVRGHIERGETYQVNLTFPMTAAFSGDADHMYTSLVAAQEPSYAAHVWHGTKHVLSVSPEQFFAVSEGRITTKPMKGTAGRGRWESEDATIRQSLHDSSKDQAENLMIVDLLRNDLGRVCDFGTVEVDELFSMEKYRTVWQMTSQISGDVRNDAGLLDIFTALFPCGSVTGAPKASSMGIIADLEDSQRGVYCGAIGYVPPGDGIEGASFNVAIRTAVIDTSEGVGTYAVGGGVTWDSHIDGEYEEALAKARVLTTQGTKVELIETIRWDEGFVLLDEHLERLSSSARYWDMPCEVESLHPLLDDVVSNLDGPTKVRIVASGEGNVTVDISDAPERFAEGPGPAEEPSRVRIDLDPLSSQDPRLFHKVTDRSHFDQRRKRNSDVDDVICVNEMGHITESTIANVAFLLDGSWVTPPRSDGLLSGVLRQKLLDEGVLEERHVTLGDASAAEAVALINSVRGWVPAVVV